MSYLFEQPPKKHENGWTNDQIRGTAKVLVPDIETALGKADSPFELASEIGDLVRLGERPRQESGMSPYLPNSRRLNSTG